MLKSVSKQIKGLKGEITIPPDKSVSHRAVMLTSLACGKSVINNFSQGADCRTTLEIFKQLGVTINEIDSNTIEIISDGHLKKSYANIYAGNSGTTTRLLSGILARQNFDSIITGDESLSKRPMKRIIEPLSLMGAEIESADGHLPLKIKGKHLQGINYTYSGSSAQVKSCVLLAGLGAEGVTTYKEQYISRNHTELLLEFMGAKIENQNDEIKIFPSVLEAKNIEVVGDISSAAFFITAGLIIPNSDITIKNVGINPTRSGILDIINRMGGDIKLLNQRTISNEQCADINVQYDDSLKGCVIEGKDIPRLIDELPIIAILASQADGQTIVKDAGDLRNKESDRISCLVHELNKIGINIAETSDGFIISGKNKIKGGVELESYHDHRLAMSFYIAGLISEHEIAINGFEWTNVSFPEFEILVSQLQ